MKIGPKYKIARRLGAPVFEKTQTQKFALAESRRGKGRKKGSFRQRPRTDFGVQMLEKQKARYSYLISEKQFGRYIRESVSQKKEKASEALYKNLETRLDNVVLRFGLAPTRSAARQMVSHGHFVIKGHRVNIPSYKVSVGDEILIRPQSAGKKIFEGMEERLASHNTPAWLSFDVKKQKGTVLAEPTLETADLLFDINSVLEFYSR